MQNASALARTLRALRAAFVTRESLKQSGAGRVLVRVAKRLTPENAELAGRIVAEWKAELDLPGAAQPQPKQQPAASAPSPPQQQRFARPRFVQLKRVAPEEDVTAKRRRTHFRDPLLGGAPAAAEAKEGMDAQPPVVLNPFLYTHAELSRAPAPSPSRASSSSSPSSSSAAVSSSSPAAAPAPALRASSTLSLREHAQPFPRLFDLAAEGLARRVHELNELPREAGPALARVLAFASDDDVLRLARSNPHLQQEMDSQIERVCRTRLPEAALATKPPNMAWIDFYVEFQRRLARRAEISRAQLRAEEASAPHREVKSLSRLPKAAARRVSEHRGGGQRVQRSAREMLLQRLKKL